MPQSAHILIVDDDRRIRELLKTYLADNGYRVTVAANAGEARERFEGLAFDLVILDVMMPGEDGLSLAASLRGNRDTTPILMLSALSETEDRIKGLATGSDDYLAKPFEPRELLLRMQNLLRRAGPKPEPLREVQFGECTFNIARGELHRRGVAVRLTSREKELLRMLVQRSGQPMSRQDLAQPGNDESARSVDVQINRLRQKIEINPSDPMCLQTVRGAGYVLILKEASLA
jgi:two-component system, OmpR family, phosphate regulon response regulator OmpR